MNLAHYISHDLAFEWTGFAITSYNDRLDAMLFHVSTGALAFRVTGSVDPAQMLGSFRADGHELHLSFELTPPTFIHVRMGRELLFRLNVSSGEIENDRGKIGEWRRKNESSVDLEGIEVARMVRGNGYRLGFPMQRNPRIYWGRTSWNDFEEIVRVATVIIDSVFYVAPETRETFIQMFGGVIQ